MPRPPLSAAVISWAPLEALPTPLDVGERRHQLRSVQKHGVVHERRNAEQHGAQVQQRRHELPLLHVDATKYYTWPRFEFHASKMCCKFIVSDRFS